ncbi:MAG TPA: protein kinase [Lacipirellulaceae bacterium]|nr:protein kinase [Lacipirellulaceae bacterium]
MADLKTILFTDIVGSVDLKSEMPGLSDVERDQAFIDRVLTPHRERIERELEGLGGRVVSTAGDGHFLVFSDTISAARWAMGIERSHRDEPICTPSGHAVSVRISMHVGIPQIDPRDANNFIGKPVDYAARLSDYATGGQILVSRSVVAVLEDAGMDGVSFHNHGRRELKGIGRVEIYELVYDREGPRQMRPQPRENLSRQWTVLPATMGLTEFRQRGGVAGLSEAGYKVGPGYKAGPATDVVPLRLGNYELEQRLGSGGMGDVYRARHAQFGRVRAVKVIKQQFVEAGHDEVIRRFYQEIKAVGKLEHQNIVVAIDSSAPTDAVHYLVMEYIEGVGADELVARNGPLGVADACEIARQAAWGLAYIHQHGMVHRDIKPSNLMVTVVRDEVSAVGSQVSGANALAGGETAVVKILDLGLALLVGDDQQRLTVYDNRAMGTAMYMSPEQWKTTSVDIRADIYSLGCTLYHLLAGKPPFWESDLKPEKAHEREKLPAIRREPRVPRGLWDTVRRMTAKNPADRYSEPAEVAEALAPFAAGHELSKLVRGTVGSVASSKTLGPGRSDTIVAKSAQSDTVARAPASWSKLPAVTAQTRQKLARIGVGAFVLAAVAVIGWLAMLAAERRASAIQGRQRALTVAAQFAGSEILKEINRRFDILNRLASEPDLRQQMVEINNEPNNEAHWKRLEEWLGARKADHARDAASDSWFINDLRGIQVARSPRSDATIGENFAFRDYFSGHGSDVSPDTKGLKPISAAHISTVYRSKSTGRLKVAFSVPVHNGRSGKDREVIGVLAMTVDLGEFNVLEKKLPAGNEVVLLDLRESTTSGPPRRGLILHHQEEETYRKGAPPPFIGREILDRIDELLKKIESEATAKAAMLENYRDDALTGGKMYWGALQPLIGRPDEPAYESHWAVIVQEPVSR